MRKIWNSLETLLQPEDALQGVLLRVPGVVVHLELEYGGDDKVCAWNLLFLHIVFIDCSCWRTSPNEQGELGLRWTTSGRWSDGLWCYPLQLHCHTARHRCFPSPSSGAGAILLWNLVTQLGGWGLINGPRSNLELVKAPEPEQDALLLLCLASWVDSCDNSSGISSSFLTTIKRL